MPIPILMPALSPTMTEGAVAAWHKKEGDAVAAGDVIAEIETDKANMELEAVDEGVLGRILVPAGTLGVKVNQPIALLLAEGEDISALDAVVEQVAAAPIPPAPTAVTPAPATVPAAAATKTGGRIFASPLAKRLAREAGIDLAVLTGSGPQGRIVKVDIDSARVGAPAIAAPAVAGVAPAAPEGAYRDLPVS
ncbi:MAG: biotin/lipoyl-containing protein, partial [Alphaproteobacteria bacterium]